MNLRKLEDYIEKMETEMTNFIDNIDKKMLIKACNLISESKEKEGRVHITGVGKTSYVAEYIAALNSSIGTPTYFLDTTEAVHGSIGQVKEEDIVIAISNSGQTIELKNTITALKKIGVKVIGVSGGLTSWLKDNVNVFLYAGVTHEGDELNKPPRSSVLVEIIILQCLSILLQQEQKLDLETYHLYHPGGSLGESVYAQIHE
ncbi:SIS domain-containing protein [Tetragenococcus koreensis]|uniref:SIS domain-containing protein n=1 Tax=Tetragenococcus koreensis TaxID=290335 RepID=UPI001F332FF0|nr:SIS domain-containing protein [Tetragenococcus koreensis]MDN6408937.1 SIS domain-containing protein [Tetragenococcus halophilus]MDN6640506.1 SIS domain-containing protein [Tetragenococcus sp.]MCF1584391.1 SIS domain-containing protein [Tetragenococcus koreensis]MCF1613940.1 SIS domain-containing protein [Tetragenococcus koreensis]MCF1620352.1 SIS domain-containing protein [Tetragenococcus koreensis]